MTSSVRRFSREELYDLVWSQPMTKLAASLGFSDVGLKKICQKHGIPVPGRGYWRKLETGAKPRRPRLGRRSVDATISIEVRTMAEGKASEQFEAVESQKVFELLPENRIEVAGAIERPHAVTAATRQVLRHHKPDEYGRVTCTSTELFLLRVSVESVDRTLRILDALLKALDKRGFATKSGIEKHERARVMINGEAVTFSIEEPSQRKAHRLTDDEKSRQAKGRLYYVPTYDYFPTGRLSLKLDTPYGAGLLGSFSDTAHVRLETRLNDVIVAMVRVAEWRKEDRRQHEEKQRRLNEENARRGEILRRQQEETARIKQLRSDADAWNAAEFIRRYIAAVEAHAKENGTDTSVGSTHHKWVQWAHAQADRIDPLRENPPSILDEKPPRLLSIWEFE